MVYNPNRVREYLRGFGGYYRLPIEVIMMFHELKYKRFMVRNKDLYQALLTLEDLETNTIRNHWFYGIVHLRSKSLVVRRLRDLEKDILCYMESHQEGL